MNDANREQIIKTLEEKREGLKRISEIDERLNKLRESKVLQEYFSLIEERGGLEKRCKRINAWPIENCQHRFAILNYYVYYDGNERIFMKSPCEDGHLATHFEYFCLDCGEKFTIEVGDMEAFRIIEKSGELARNAHAFSFVDLVSLSAYYRELVMSRGAEGAMNVFLDSYEDVLRRKKM